MYIGLRVKYRLLLSYFNGTSNFRNLFSKIYSNTKFHGNPSSGSRAVPCDRTDGHDEVNVRFPHFCEKRPHSMEPEEIACANTKRTGK